MKKLISIWVAVMFLGLFIPQGVQAEDVAAGSSGTYLEGVKQAYVRGVKNIVSSPFEIFRGVRDAKDGKKCPLGSHFVVGGLKGVGKGLLRCGSGAWDLVAGLIPGHQDGMPVDPKTLF